MSYSYGDTTKRLPYEISYETMLDIAGDLNAGASWAVIARPYGIPAATLRRAFYRKSRETYKDPDSQWPALPGNMPESDPKYMMEGEWTRQNGTLGVGRIFGREGRFLLIDASSEIRAVPFKVREDKVRVCTGPVRENR